MPEEEKEQEIGNLFEKIMKENFLSLVKKNVQEAQRLPHKMDAKRPTPKPFYYDFGIIIKCQR